MGMLGWVMMGLAIWHFTIFLPDRFWGGIVGAFVGALAGAILIGLLIYSVKVSGLQDPRQEGDRHRGRAVCGSGCADRHRGRLLRGRAARTRQAHTQRLSDDPQRPSESSRHPPEPAGAGEPAAECPNRPVVWADG